MPHIAGMHPCCVGVSPEYGVAIGPGAGGGGGEVGQALGLFALLIQPLLHMSRHVLEHARVASQYEQGSSKNPMAPH
jgi:hypothetical protein